MKKKIIAVALSGMVVATCVVGAVYSPNMINRTIGKEVEYTFTLSSTKNKINIDYAPTGIEWGESTFKTTNGNNIVFHYEKITHLNDVWDEILPGGCVYNMTDITGIKSIVIKRKETISSLHIQWSDTTTFDGVNKAKLEFNDNVASFDFNDYEPTHFKLSIDEIYTDSVQIESMTVTYSCQNNISNVTVIPNNQDCGVVTGSGRYKVGESITLTATPNEGYVFEGWYQNAVSIRNYRKSTDSEFTTKLYRNNETWVANFVLEGVTPGQSITFGSYPQNELALGIEVEYLEDQVGILPTAEDSFDWIDYGYRLQGSEEPFMWYKDVMFGSDKYRGVYFTEYRDGKYTGGSQGGDIKYTKGKVHWFSYQPLVWDIVSYDEVSGEMKVLCKTAIDGQPFNEGTLDVRTIDGKTVYSSNYEHSTVRSFLNNHFYNTAFSSEEKAKVQTMLVDNSYISARTSSDTYCCNNTNDKVTLASFLDLSNDPFYSLDCYDSFRARLDNEYTPYSICQLAAPRGCDRYLTRSAYGANGVVCCTKQGFLAHSGECQSSTNYVRGIVPLITIKIA